MRFGNPVWSPDSQCLALSDDHNDGVYLYDTHAQTCMRLTDAPSSGYAYRWSSDGRRLGFKLLMPVAGRLFPLQMPVVFDLDQHKLIPLHEAVQRAGVPSFSDDGRVVFTIDQELRVVDAAGQLLTTFPLGTYANLAQISPDGTQVAYSGPDGVVRLIVLATGQTRQLTSDEHAYFNPVWSPDSARLLVSTISGRLKAIDVPTGQLHVLDDGTGPCWGPDSRTVFYTRTDRVDGMRVTDSDIYSIQWDGSGKTRLTSEAGEHETSARVSPDGQHVAFVSMQDGKLYRAPLARNTQPGNGSAGHSMGAKVQIAGEGMSVSTLGAGAAALSSELAMAQPLATTLSTQALLTAPVPYLNQVYDTTDAFDGDWACGASSALMAINYYGILPYWDITCSWPYTHISHYGAYVSEIYTYNGYTYNIRSKDASSQWAYGGYGYIVRDNWADTKGYMRDYIINHGLGSAVDWSPSWSKLQTEVNADAPFVVLNMLTTAGHYITTIGYFTNQYTAIFNDPYGNKNTPGYPSYDGAGAMYDWPGFNNGYANLNTVHCFIYCRSQSPPIIIQQPQNEEALWGDNAQFTIVAIGKNTLSYQWQKGTSNLVNGGHYTGVTGATLTILNVTEQEAGDYRCVLTNAYGNTTSDSATLTVIGSAVAPGDVDRDGDVDVEDFGLVQWCLSGPSVPQNNPACSEAMLDNDNDVDRDDVNIFLACMSGADVPADLNCAN